MPMFLAAETSMSLSDFLANGTTMVSWLASSALSLLETAMSHPVMYGHYFIGMAFAGIALFRALRHS